MKISKDEYYIRMARCAARSSGCLHRQYGAVLVRDDIVISTGANGAAADDVNCCDNGECWREAHEAQQCKAVHAEINAILNAARLGVSTVGSTLYLAGFENGKPLKYVIPCDICRRIIQNAGIERVVSNWWNDDTPQGYAAGSPPEDA